MTTLDIAHMTIKEWLDLIGELWDSLSAEHVTLTPAQEAELARRLTAFDAAQQPYILTPEEEAELDVSIGAEGRGDLADDDEIRAIWAKHGR